MAMLVFMCFGFLVFWFFEFLIQGFDFACCTYTYTQSFFDGMPARLAPSFLSLTRTSGLLFLALPSPTPTTRPLIDGEPCVCEFTVQCFLMS